MRIETSSINDVPMMLNNDIWIFFQNILEISIIHGIFLTLYFLYNTAFNAFKNYIHFSLKYLNLMVTSEFVAPVVIFTDP